MGLWEVMMMKKVAFVGVMLMCVALVGGDQEVVVKDVEPFWYVSMAFKGSLTQMESNINRFMQEFFGQGLMPVGPGLSVYHNSPMEVKEEDLSWEFGFTVGQDVDVKEPLKRVEVKGMKAAVYLLTGPYDGLPGAWEKVIKWVGEQGYEAVYPVYDRYLNNPMQVKPEELKTEIIVPIKKK